MRTRKDNNQEEYSLSGDGRGRDLSWHGEKTDRGRCTHFLKMAEGGTCQDTEKNRASEEHSPPGEDRGRDFVRIRNESDRAWGTHQLGTTEGGTCQDT